MDAMSLPQRLLLWTLALAPFGTAVLAHRQGSLPTLSITQRALPALAFDQYLVDLGPVQPTAEVRANFLFRHRGKHPVQILDLTPSCGCLQPRLKKKEYQPGETDMLVLRVLPANEAPGKHEYTVDVKYRDPELHTVRVTFRVELPEKGISITPPAVMVYQFSDQETVQQIRITDTRETSWNVLGVSTTLPFVNVTAGEPKRTEEGALELLVDATVDAHIPNGRHQGIIRVFTDSPEYPELKVPLLIQGREENAPGDSTEEHSKP